MNSYISSFKAVLAALMAIVAIEVAYAAVDPSSPADRTGYLNWNFNANDTIHKFFISEKAKNAIADRPDVIQVGDSSGFHGVVPGIVEQYLGGLRYDNLSCCANTGFDGYYSIAQFMLRHVSSIKAVVLYVSLNNLPGQTTDADALVVGGQERLRNAFGSGAALTNLPTLAARHDIVRWVYGLGGSLFQRGLQTGAEQLPEFMHSLQATKGWRPEPDIHMTADRQAETMASLCGVSGIRSLSGDEPGRATTDLLGNRRTLTEVELRRLADLTARHGAKLVVIFQPYPCRGLDGSLLPILREDMAKVEARYPNVVVPDPKLFETWPSRSFSSADHVRVGNEEAISRRAGRLIAAALGLSPAEPPSPSPGPSVPVMSLTGVDLEAWRPEGVTLEPVSGTSVRMLERLQSDSHLVKKEFPALPAKTYTATLTFSNAGKRNVFLQFVPLQWPGDTGYFVCGSAAGEVLRMPTVVDADIVKLSDSEYRCSGTFRILKPGLVLLIGLTPDEVARPYAGDGQSNIVLHRFDLVEVPDRY